MHRDDHAAMSRLPLVVGIAAVVALTGALVYILAGSQTGASTNTSASAVPRRSALVNLTSPSGQTFSNRFVSLRARVTGGAHDVRLQFRTSAQRPWRPVPGVTLSSASGAPVEVPLATDAHGFTARVRWDMAAVNPQDALVWIRATATSTDGDPLASEPAIAALTRRGPTPADPEAPSVNDGVVFAGGSPIHVTWEASVSALSLPDHSYVEVPIAGYAVDVVEEGHLLPPARIATTSTSFDVPVPPQSEHLHQIVVRPIDAAGNVGEAHVTAEFVSKGLLLVAPHTYQTVLRNAPVPLRAQSSGSLPVCFQYREADATVATGESPPSFIPMPAGEVTDAAGKPIGSWPVQTSRSGSLYRWHGLRHAPPVNGLPGRQVEVRAIAVAPDGGCSGARSVSQVVTITWSLPPKVCSLDPATPDPNDECWGAGLPGG